MLGSLNNRMRENVYHIMQSIICMHMDAACPGIVFCATVAFCNLPFITSACSIRHDNYSLTYTHHVCSKKKQCLFRCIFWASLDYRILTTTFRH
jgi:hypothetical protein